MDKIENIKKRLIEMLNQSKGQSEEMLFDSIWHEFKDTLTSSIEVTIFISLLEEIYNNNLNIDNLFQYIHDKKDD